MSNILILGAGRVGATVAEQLVYEQHNVTIVDDNPANLAPLTSKLDLRVVAGSASSPTTLREAGAADAELLLAVTPTDELNMVACKIAYQMFRVPTRIARIRNADLLAHADLFAEEDGFAISHTITPAQVVTDYLTRLVKMPEALQVLDFANGLVQLVVTRVTEGAPMAGKPLTAFNDVLPNIDRRVVGIYRKNHYIRPDGDTELFAGDEVFVLAETRQMRKVIGALHVVESPINNVLLAGGGNVGYRLAKALQKDYSVKLVESDPNRAEWLANELPGTLVLHGDATNETMFEAEQIHRTDMYLALTSDDEDNIMSALLARQMGARKVVSIINRSRYVDLLQDSRIDVALSPAQLTIGTLLAHARQGDIAAVKPLRRGAAEAVELVVHGNKSVSRVIGRRVDEIRMPAHAFLATIVRSGKVIMVHHDTVIEADDRCIVFVHDKMRTREVEHLFAVKLGFF
ncbi:trk system potassium uptake protein TrkA [Silvimonas terrae]|uniref:Trk system potassium uptake protein TrkA n=1 Tax=Silvimonas terrae TaxID=300266 RepID=A0A840RL38_9NEIS|nr:Trk system potassium transporter TrkA [Silvimonas terrae]MBB5193304.1 trk system potassium uptake protein TrkA [Silvimonas terrae]